MSQFLNPRDPSNPRSNTPSGPTNRFRLPQFENPRRSVSSAQSASYSSILQFLNSSIPQFLNSSIPPFAPPPSVELGTHFTGVRVFNLLEDFDRLGSSSRRFFGIAKPI
jgi:hypothetical protein